MGKIFATLVLSLYGIFLINLIWVLTNMYYFAVDGFQTLFVATTFVENVYFSVYLKWILLLDFSYLISVLIFMATRKNYKTDSKLHNLAYDPIKNPKICVTMHTYNEEQVIKKTVKDFVKQDNVEKVIVIDNHSTDRTVEQAEEAGATVITKTSNKGYAHSWYVGLREALKTDADIIVITDGDGTYNGYDIKKMVPYLDNCDMVIGTRQIQVLTEKGNQNDTFLVWGNLFLAKLMQLKYFNLRHLGVAPLSDVGCMHRCIKKDMLEKIIDKFTRTNSDEVIIGNKSGLFAILMTMIGIENNFRIVEIPITFKKRLGISKTQADKKINALRYGLDFFWCILMR